MGGREASRTREVGDISEQPYEEELHRQGVCTPGLVVCDKLGELWWKTLSAPAPLLDPLERVLDAYQKAYPSREADTPKDARESFPHSGRLECRWEGGDKGRHGVLCFNSDGPHKRRGRAIDSPMIYDVVCLGSLLFGPLTAVGGWRSAGLCYRLRA